jgi:hypothetical protein
MICDTIVVLDHELTWNCVLWKPSHPSQSHIYHQQDCEMGLHDLASMFLQIAVIEIAIATFVEGNVRHIFEDV